MLDIFKSLKIQLLSTALLAVLFLLAGVWCITRGFLLIAIVLIAIVCIYLIVLNLWFWNYVTGPIDNLTDFTQRIADGSYGIQMDIPREDEIGYLTDGINEMSEKVAIGEKYRTEFVSQLSHELRTPLTAITGWSELIADDPAVEGDSLRGVQIISKEADRLTNMVKDLLEFTRIQDGRFNLRIGLIDIDAELNDAIYAYGNLFEQAGITIEYDAPDGEIPLIPGDEERLKQVFLNIMDNASKHGGEGNKLDVKLYQENDKIHITFRDYGKGIPPEELPHVKERFYKGSSKNRGTGIGLAVCDEILTRHNGQLNITNAEGGGCCVEIVLPMQA